MLTLTGPFMPYHTIKSIQLEAFYSLFETTFEKDYSFAGEAHDFWEILYVADGAVCVSADEQIFHLSEGQLIFHKPMEFHKFHIENEKPAKLFVTSFSAAGSQMKDFEHCVLSLSAEQRQGLEHIRKFLCSEHLLPDDCDDEGLRAMSRNPALFQKFLCMMELWLLSLTKGSVTVSAAPDTSETIAYRKAIQAMEKHQDEWLSVAEIARECAVSVSFLKKVFAKYAGLGIHQYFLKTKIISASRMLKEGKSVSETAAALAFSSPNYFSTVYKRETGVSPFAYKNMEV